MADKTNTGTLTKSGGTGGSAGEPKLSLVEKLKRYWLELVYEWRKVSWPERKQWIDSTNVVFIFCLFLMLVLTVFDVAVAFIMSKIFGG